MRKIAIVGNGLTRDRAPFDDDTYEIWTTGSVAPMLPRVTDIYDIHTDDAIQPIDKLNIPGARVWMQDEREDVPMSRVFPIYHLEDRFGKVFNCSMTMMLGKAILEADEIRIYGVDFAEGYEPAYRVTFVYLLGLARGMGVNVYIEPGSLVFHDWPTYQYDMSDPVESKIKENLAAWRRDIDSLESRAQYLRGATEAASQILTLIGG